MSHIAVVGVTSWGLTLASLVARGGGTATVIARSTAEAASIATHGLPGRLPPIHLGPALAVCAPDAVATSLDGVIVAVPAQSLRSTLTALPLSRDLPVLSAAKGIELSTGSLMSDVLRDCGWPAHLISAISGPNLAREIVAGLPAAAVIASSAEAQAAMWQKVLSSQTFRAYSSPDIIGIEVGGALKNVVAIAAGAAAGLGFGANTIAALMTRGLAEITRFGVALGANPLTFQGLAGVGDLAATCFSDLSRNRRLGEALARGMSPEDAIASLGGVAEGAATAAIAVQRASALGIEVPIAAAVAAVLEGTMGVPQAMARLLTRPLTGER